MPLTPTEASANFARLRTDIDKLEAALRKDEDGKVRVTAAEGKDIMRTLPGHVLALVIDILD